MSKGKRAAPLENPGRTALKEQYKDSSNFRKRTALHARFGTNRYSFYRWVFDQFELASVRAMRIVGTPQTSAARRAAVSFSMNSRVGTTTLPPRWPHFFADESWSSKCTPAAPASIIAFISS